MKIVKYIVKPLLYLLVALLVFSCDSDDDTVMSGMTASVSDKFEAKIQFISNLKDEALIKNSSDFASVNDYYLKNQDKSWLTILDRADNSELSNIMTIAMNTNRWTSFAFNKLKDRNTYEGSMLFHNEPTRSVNSHVLGKGAYVTGFSPLMRGTRTDIDEDGNEMDKVEVSFNINFYTAKFNTQEQIDSFSGEGGVMNILKRKHMNLIMIGTIKNNLFDSLKSKVLETDDTFQVKTLEIGSEYTIFMLNEERFWGFRDLKKVSLTPQISSYEISVKW